MVTLHPLSLIVQEVVGDRFEVTTLLPAGLSPHAYDPVPSAVRKASSAHLILAADPDVDGWSIALTDREVWWFNSPEQTIPKDPHFWLDPLAVKASLPRLVEQLCRLAPADCVEFGDRSSRFGTLLENLAAHGLSTLRGRECVVSAPFMNGAAERFGLVILDTISSAEGVEPSIKDIRRAAQAAERAGLVLAQRALPERAAILVSQISGSRLAVIDVIGTPESHPDYASLIEQLIRVIGGGA